MPADFHRRLDSIHDRHHDVHDDAVDFIFLHFTDSLTSVKGGHNAVALRFEINFDGIDDGFIIVTNKNIVHFFSPVNACFGLTTEL